MSFYWWFLMWKNFQIRRRKVHIREFLFWRSHCLRQKHSNEFYGLESRGEILILICMNIFRVQMLWRIGKFAIKKNKQTSAWGTWKEQKSPNNSNHIETSNTPSKFQLRISISYEKFSSLAEFLWEFSTQWLFTSQSFWDFFSNPFKEDLFTEFIQCPMFMKLQLILGNNFHHIFWAFKILQLGNERDWIYFCVRRFLSIVHAYCNILCCMSSSEETENYHFKVWSFRHANRHRH